MKNGFWSQYLEILMNEMESEKLATDFGWSCSLAVIHVANVIHF